jgi:hypothetical protein
VSQRNGRTFNSVRQEEAPDAERTETSEQSRGRPFLDVSGNAGGIHWAEMVVPDGLKSAVAKRRFSAAAALDRSRSSLCGSSRKPRVPIRAKQCLAARTCLILTARAAARTKAGMIKERRLWEGLGERVFGETSKGMKCV